MFGFKPVSKQVREVQKQNFTLQQKVREQEANLDYIAMMTDTDFPEDEEVTENE